VLDHAHLASLAVHLPAENVRQLLLLFLDQIEAQIVTLEALSAQLLVIVFALATYSVIQRNNRLSRADKAAVRTTRPAA